MHRERDERDDERRQQREELTNGDRRFPVQVRATFIRLDRSPKQQASAA